MSPPLVTHLRERIRNEGPLSFRDFMEEALYHPEFGYYNSIRNPIGRRGRLLHFLGSRSDLRQAPGAKVRADGVRARRIPGSVYHRGTGRRARSPGPANPAAPSFPAIESWSAAHAMRERQRASLQGFDVEWLEALPAGITGCVFSNEFFDALPVRRVICRNGALREIHVTSEFTEVEGDLQEPLDISLAEGQLADINTDARQWIKRIGASLDRGYHLAIDYGYQDREFYARPRGTLMCYWRHQAVEDPYLRIGEQDITAHVNFSDLIREGAAVGLTTEEFKTQMDFLVQLGVLEELEALMPADTAEAIQRVMAVKKLVLPGGMGERFKVLVQRK